MRAERSIVLTPVELRIARLVAVGRRNDEVAGELALSPKTVEWRLTRRARPDQLLRQHERRSEGGALLEPGLHRRQ